MEETTHQENASRSIRSPHPLTANLVGALLVRDGTILLGRRAAERTFYPDVWDIFGGHVEADEEPEHTLVRELQEELGITPATWTLLQTVEIGDDEHGAMVFRIYAVRAWTGTPANLQPHEHSEIGWFTLAEATQLPLAHSAYPDLFTRVLTRTLDELLAVCRFIHGFSAPWWVGGGWAIDLWAGAWSRPHEDIEICVHRRDLPAVFAYCAGWQPFVPGGKYFVPLPPDERIVPPAFMLQFGQTPDTSASPDMPPTFEFLLNDTDGDQWLLPHDHAVRVPFERIRATSPFGVSVAAPEVVLLIKAWYPRPKDQHDFERALPLLDGEQRRWLRKHLERWKPYTPWLEALRDA
jgi:8-oxo-dGTP diphosphatase